MVKRHQEQKQEVVKTKSTVDKWCSGQKYKYEDKSHFLHVFIYGMDFSSGTWKFKIL